MILFIFDLAYHIPDLLFALDGQVGWEGGRLRA